MILAGERPVPVPLVHRKCRHKYQPKSVIAVCSQIHTKHINTVCGQNVQFVNVKLVVHIVTTAEAITWQAAALRLVHTQPVACVL